MINGAQTFAGDSDIATRSPFNFTVLSNDPVLVEALTTKIKDKAKQSSNLKFRVDGARVHLRVVVQQHTASNVNPEALAFSVAHTTNSHTIELANALLSKGQDQSDQVKKLLANLVVSAGDLKYMNVIGADYVDEVDEVVATIVKNLSLRIDGYYYP